ncbi:MAG TPA: metalloregulator ArsR/SmtB family transcription factor [Ktedonobacteraceae bacterium]
MELIHNRDLSPVEVGQVLHQSPRSGTSLLTADEAALYARFFQVLSDPTRVRLLNLLLETLDAGRTVSELVEAIGAPQSRISTHLGCLRWCGLVQTARDGKQVYYRIADPRVRDLLALGGAMMRDYAAGIASCGVIR